LNNFGQVRFERRLCCALFATARSSCSTDGTCGQSSRLDVLQGSQNACLAFLLQTLMSLKTKLNAVPLSLAKPLHEALLTGINKTFQQFV